MSIVKQLRAQLRQFAMVFSLAVIWFGFNYVTHGAFLDARNLSNLFRQMAITGILACGMTLVIVMGQIDLSVGSFTAFLGAILAVLDRSGMHPLHSFLITVGAGIAIGAAQGSLVSFLRVPAFIATLGGMMSLRGATMWMTQNSTVPLQSESLLAWGNGNISTGTTLKILLLAGFIYVGLTIYYGARRHRLNRELFPVSRICMAVIVGIVSLGFSGWVFISHEGIPYPVLILILVALLVYFLAVRTIWGRHVYAIGGNKEAAYLSGVPVRLRLVSVFILSGILSAIAGLVLTARVGSASPDAGQLLELDAIAACVIGGTSLMGGRGTIPGALVGALVIESLNNGMSLANMEPYWQYVIKGLVLVIAVGLDMASRPKKGLFE